LSKPTVITKNGSASDRDMGSMGIFRSEESGREIMNDKSADARIAQVRDG
jgi:hypothetical protein